MRERRLVTKKSCSYNGIIDLNNMKKVIKDWCRSNNCKIDNSRTEERIHEDKKEILFETTIRREVADWMNVVLLLGIDFRNMQIVEVEIDGVKKEMWKVDASVGIKSIIESDSEEKWVGQPVLLFARHLIDKFIAKSEPAKAEKNAKRLAGSLLDEIRAYMNLEKLALE